MATAFLNAKVLGIVQTVTALETLKLGVQKRALGKAVRAGNAPTVKAVKRTAPRRKGHLKRAVTQKVKRYQNGNIVSVVGPKMQKLADGENPGKYAHLVEGGTKPHVIPGAQFTLPGGERIGPIAVKHPGTKPTRWMRRAADATKSETIKAFSDKLTTEVAAEVRKARAKGIE